MTDASEARRLPSEETARASEGKGQGKLESNNNKETKERRKRQC